VPAGRFVTFEGIEGCGKSTQLGLLGDHLRARGLRVVATREPGGTPLGERLRAIILDPDADPAPVAELLMVQAARAQHVQRVIAPAVADGAWVLSDRFSDSSLAYQGAARGLGIPMVTTLNEIACGSVRPDRTLVLDLPVEVGLARARARAGQTARNCRFEDEHLAFHRAVAEAFRELAAREPGRVRLLDATGDPAEIHARALRALADLLP
jgi:dTMP kinase